MNAPGGGFAHVRPADAPYRERRGGGASSSDLAGALAAEHLTLRTWRFGPGAEMAYHRHRIQNRSDREAVWLTIGAPPGDGITDGIRLDPATGEEIPGN